MEAAPPRRARTRPSAAPWGPGVAALGGWVLVVLAGHLLGQRLVDADPLVRIGAPPLVGMLDPVLSPRLLPAVLLGVAAVLAGPGLAARLRWTVLLGAAWAASAAWMFTLAMSGGLSAVSAPLASRYEYLAALPALRGRGVADVLSSYTTTLAAYPTHVKGHPPGFALLVWGMDAVGLSGATAAAVIVIAVGALVAPAVMTAAREVVGETTARSAAPFLAFTPAAVWMATSADAFFAGVSAVGIALMAVAVHRRGRGSAAAAVGAGLILGAALLFSYGVAPLGLLVIALVLATRRWDALLLGTLGVAVMLAGAAALGFWWLDGLDATRTLYTQGVSSRRPYASFLVISLAAFACATGPAPWAGMMGLRSRAAWLLPGAALAAVLAADLSGLSKGENERIWLPFVGWIVLAAAGLSRGWLATGVVLGIVLQVALRSPW